MFRAQSVLASPRQSRRARWRLCRMARSWAARSSGSSPAMERTASGRCAIISGRWKRPWWPHSGRSIYEICASTSMLAVLFLSRSEPDKTREGLWKRCLTIYVLSCKIYLQLESVLQVRVRRTLWILNIWRITGLILQSFPVTRW